MKIKKINYNFSVAEIIKANLSVQTIQKNLKDNFGINNPSVTIFNNSNFIKTYKTWGEEKRHKFIKTLGGVVYYGKVKEYLEELIEGKEKNI